MACGTCAGEHETKDCRRAVTARKCALCKGSHPAWSKDCQYRIREVERTNSILQSTPIYYGAGRRDAAQATPEKRILLRPHEGSNGWQVVGKGRRGRPSQLAAAGNAADQTRIKTSTLKRQRRNSSPEEEDEVIIEATQSTQEQPLATLP
jgi:hypothetical protein